MSTPLSLTPTNSKVSFHSGFSVLSTTRDLCLIALPLCLPPVSRPAGMDSLQYGSDVPPRSAAFTPSALISTQVSMPIPLSLASVADRVLCFVSGDKGRDAAVASKGMYVTSTSRRIGPRLYDLFFRSVSGKSIHISLLSFGVRSRDLRSMTFSPMTTSGNGEFSSITATVSLRSFMSSTSMYVVWSQVGSLLLSTTSVLVLPLPLDLTYIRT